MAFALYSVMKAADGMQIGRNSQGLTLTGTTIILVGGVVTLAGASDAEIGSDVHGRWGVNAQRGRRSR